MICRDCEYWTEDGCYLWDSFFHIRVLFDLYYDGERKCPEFSERLPEYVPTILYGVRI